LLLVEVTQKRDDCGVKTEQADVINELGLSFSPHISFVFLCTKRILELANWWLQSDRVFFLLDGACDRGRKIGTKRRK
jgi:hypothetical protein